MTTRRSFIGSILAAGMAPAIVKAEILMPVRKIIVPESGLSMLSRRQHEIDVSIEEHHMQMVRDMIIFGVLKYQADKEAFFLPASQYEQALKGRA